jgi:hypothetical protein
MDAKKIPKKKVREDFRYPRFASSAARDRRTVTCEYRDTGERWRKLLR